MTLFLAMLVPLGVSAESAAAEPWRTRPIAGGEMRYLLPVPTEADYPIAALRAGIEGRTVVRLTVSPEGTIIACETVESAGLPQLDERACEMYRQRARFDFTGVTKPVTLQAPVRWQLADSAAPVEPAAAH